MSPEQGFDESVDEFLAAQTHLRSAALQPDLPVCKSCRGAVGLLIGFSEVNERYELCAPCWGYRHGQRVEQHGLADGIFPLLYAVSGRDQTSRDMWNYKDPRLGGPNDNIAFAGLASVLYVTLRDHWPCLQSNTGTSPECVTVIPSTQKPGQPSPLLELVTRVLRRLPLPTQVQELLSYRGPSTTAGGKQRGVVDPELFSAERIDPGEDILLVEDTWVSGSHAQSGATALKRAGARSVTVLVLARWLDPRHAPGEYLLEALPNLPQPGSEICPFVTPGLHRCLASATHH